MKIKIRDQVSKKVREQLPEYDERRKRIWDECVNLAKTAVRDYKAARIIVADLAIKACHIQKGGRPRHEFYTVKKFAKAIGLPYTTVSNWVTVRQMINGLEDEKVREFALENFALVNKYVPVRDKDKIEPHIKNIMKAKPGYFKWKKYAGHLKSIKFNTLHSGSMREADKDDLLLILHLCKEIAFNIGKFTKD